MQTTFTILSTIFTGGAYGTAGGFISTSHIFAMGFTITQNSIELLHMGNQGTKVGQFFWELSEGVDGNPLGWFNAFSKSPEMYEMIKPKEKKE